MQQGNNALLENVIPNQLLKDENALDQVTKTTGNTNTSPYHGKSIICGYVNGQKFRPSNWPDRLCETAAQFDMRAKIMRYASYLIPFEHPDHAYCVKVDFDDLAKNQPEAFEHVVDFIQCHQLELYFQKIV